jgi:hypothetical protein
MQSSWIGTGKTEIKKIGGVDLQLVKTVQDELRKFRDKRINR